MNILSDHEARMRDQAFEREDAKSAHVSHADRVRFADSMMRDPEPWDADECPKCTTDFAGIVYCDAHRPPPPPDPEGACVLCHFVGRVDDLVTGKDGIKWHRHCASDNS